MTRKTTASDFDADKFAEALQQIVATPPPKKKASATETIRKSAAELRALVAKGWTHEELARSFTEKGVPISAATLQKAISKKRGSGKKQKEEMNDESKEEPKEEKKATTPATPVDPVARNQPASFPTAPTSIVRNAVG